MKKIWLWALAAVMLTVAGCTSTIGGGGGRRSAAEELPELTLAPGYYTVWLETGGGAGNVVFWTGKKDPKGGSIVINKIFLNNTPSDGGAVLAVDFTANPFDTPESEFWWANFEGYVQGGRYAFGHPGDKWGGGFNPRIFKDYKYIGFSILLDNRTYPRIGDVLVEIDGEYFMFIDLVKQLMGVEEAAEAEAEVAEEGEEE